MKILSLFFMAMLVCSLSASSADEPVVTSCDRLAEIAKSDEPVRHRFDVTANVSFVTTNTTAFIAFQDGSGAVLAHHLSNAARCGDRVRVRGITTRIADANAASVHCSSIEVLAHGEPVRPTQAKPADIAAGKLDFRLVTLTCTIRDAFPDEIDDNFYVLSVVSERHHFYVPVCTSAIDAHKLIGARATITGICEPRPYCNRKYVGRNILANEDGIVPFDEARPDPFAAPDVSALIGLDPATIGCMPQHQTSGRVLAVWNRNCLIIKSRNGAVSTARIASPTLPETGDTIALSGFPETDLYHINFDKAVWKHLTMPEIPLHAATRISAQAVMTSGAISPPLHGQQVCLRGVVRSMRENASGDGIVTIESEGILVPVVTRKEDLQDLVPDCVIEATGICVFSIEDWRPSTPIPRITGFSVVTRDHGDIAIISRPSWWTPAKLLAVIGGLAVILVAILIWNASLRILANRRGHALLKARIGSATEKLKVEERTRLAVELHDSLAQNLSGISMELESAINFSDEDLPEMRRHLSIAAKALKSSREDLRNCLFDLRSQALEDPSLSSAIVKTLQPHLYGAKLSVRFNVPRKSLYDNTVQALLRAIRELVINGIRHGKATEIKVAGEMDKDGLKCSVRDNGCGFDPDDCPGVLEGHFGLQGVRERIHGLGGTVTISSAPGKGTKTVITIRSPKGTRQQDS